MNKLSGEAYTQYWQTRIAKGPEQVSFNGQDADKQGTQIWSFVSGILEDMRPPTSILDHGCGYGRMLRRLHLLWPQAKKYGVDICQAALDDIAHEPRWFHCGQPKLSNSIPESLKVDLVFDCMALQHITDESVLRAVSTATNRVLAKGGRLVLFENVSQPGAEHVLDYQQQDYMDLWPKLQWTNYGVLMLGLQGHALMVGQK